MKIRLEGERGGIGSAIKESLKEHEMVEQDADWLIFAQGYIGEDDLSETFDANLFYCIELTDKFLRYLKKGVIYISSTAGIRGNTKFPVYSASKAALNSYCETMARKHPKLRFYSICPGPTDTAMWRKLNLPGAAQAPSEVAKAVRLCMEGAFESGSIITVRDGVISV